MYIETQFDGLDYGTGGTYTATEFRCEKALLDQCADRIGSFGGFYQNFIDEVSCMTHWHWECDLEAVEAGDVDEEILADERGYYIAEADNFTIGLYHGWGMADTVALSCGAVIARVLFPELVGYWVSEFGENPQLPQTPAEAREEFERDQKMTQADYNAMCRRLRGESDDDLAAAAG